MTSSERGPVGGRTILEAGDAIVIHERDAEQELIGRRYARIKYSGDAQHSALVVCPDEPFPGSEIAGVAPELRALAATVHESMLAALSLATTDQQRHDAGWALVSVRDMLGTIATRLESAT